MPNPKGFRRLKSGATIDWHAGPWPELSAEEWRHWREAVGLSRAGLARITGLPAKSIEWWEQDRVPEGGFVRRRSAAPVWAVRALYHTMLDYKPELLPELELPGLRAYWEDESPEALGLTYVDGEVASEVAEANRGNQSGE